MRGDRLTATPNSRQTGLLHQAPALVTPDHLPDTGHRVVHVAEPRHGVVLRVDVLELLGKDLVSQSPRGG